MNYDNITAYIILLILLTQLSLGKISVSKKKYFVASIGSITILEPRCKVSDAGSNSSSNGLAIICQFSSTELFISMYSCMGLTRPREKHPKEVFQDFPFFRLTDFFVFAHVSQLRRQTKKKKMFYKGKTQSNTGVDDIPHNLLTLCMILIKLLMPG